MEEPVMNAIGVGRWKVGYDSGAKRAVLVLEFSDREPMVIAINPSAAVEIGKALVNLDTPGVPTPLRPN
jgi:hypothetical protein